MDIFGNVCVILNVCVIVVVDFMSHNVYFWDEFYLSLKGSFFILNQNPFVSSPATNESTNEK